ncbi:MAG TPA: cytochrome c-type biogenesis CcmF C-terminal domain-containing protein, partial [Thermaerobacter sp.]
GYIVHLGVVLILIGLTGMYGYQRVETVGMEPGDTYELGGYTITYHGLGRRISEGVPAVYADLTVSRDGRLVGRLQPERRFYPGFEQTMGAIPEVAMITSLSRDLYVVLGGWEGQTAGFEFYLNPMVAWIWIGGYLLVGGTVFSLWPRPALASVRARIMAELSELEYDYRMGKIGREEYERVRRGLVAAAGARLGGWEEAERAVEAEIEEAAARLRAAAGSGPQAPAGAGPAAGRQGPVTGAEGGRAGG